MATFESTKTALSKLLEQIVEGKIQLPDFQRGWIESVRKSRAVRTTELGRRELKRRLGVACDN